MSNIIVKPADKIRQHLPEIIKSLPPEAKERFRQSALGIAMLPHIANCTPDSVCKCIFTAARLNLNPDPAMHLCAIVPFRNSKINATEATFIIEYRGLIALARRACPDLYIDAGTVYENDEYELLQGTENRLTIRKQWWLNHAEPGKALFSYCISKTPNEFMLRLVIISQQEGVKIAKASKQGYRPGTIWYDHEDRMREKTAVRRSSRFWMIDPDKPEAVQFRQAIELDEEYDHEATGALIDDSLQLEEGLHSTKPKRKADKDERPQNSQQELPKKSTKSAKKAAPEVEKDSGNDDVGTPPTEANQEDGAGRDINDDFFS